MTGGASSPGPVPTHLRSTPLQLPARRLVRWIAIGTVSLTARLPAQPAAPLTACLDTLRTSREGAHIGQATWELVLSAPLDSAVLTQLDAQPEVRLPVWDYLAAMVDEERVRDGRAELSARRATFDSVVMRFGVPAPVVAAVWGIESEFGRGTGQYDVLRSLTTLACAGRRQPYFRAELLAALRIVEAGHITPEAFLGSWAGAFGQTQFMPRSFESRAIDLDGDGRRDLIGNVGDALGSAGNYLRRSGWDPTLRWGVEVRLPASVALPPPASARRRARARRTMAAWRATGITRVDGEPLSSTDLPPSTEARLFAPAGRDGPVFLVTRNYDALLRYIASERYALSVAHLSDRLGGAGLLLTPWPTDDPGLSREDRRELHRQLLARGHPVGPVSALLTSSVRTAVRAEQQRLGVEVTGRPGQRLLTALRADSMR
jgi:lytic murein transglycosylase